MGRRRRTGCRVLLVRVGGRRGCSRLVGCTSLVRIRIGPIRRMSLVVQSCDCLSGWSGWFTGVGGAVADCSPVFGCGAAVDAVHVVGLWEAECEVEALFGDGAVDADFESACCHP